MFIANNHASFRLWCQKNLVKYKKFGKYYDHDCLQKFFLLFMSLLTAPSAKFGPQQKAVITQDKS